MKRIVVDTESYLSLVKELQSVHFTMDKMLEEYRLSQ